MGESQLASHHHHQQVYNDYQSIQKQTHNKQIGMSNLDTPQQNSAMSSQVKLADQTLDNK